MLLMRGSLARHWSRNGSVVASVSNEIVNLYEPLFPVPLGDVSSPANSPQFVTPVAAQMRLTVCPRAAVFLFAVRMSDGAVCARPPPVGGSGEIGGCVPPVGLVGGVEAVGVVPKNLLKRSLRLLNIPLIPPESEPPPKRPEPEL